MSIKLNRIGWRGILFLFWLTMISGGMVFSQSDPERQLSNDEAKAKQEAKERRDKVLQERQTRRDRKDAPTSGKASTATNKRSSESKSRKSADTEVKKTGSPSAIMKDDEATKKPDEASPAPKEENPPAAGGEGKSRPAKEKGNGEIVMEEDEDSFTFSTAPEGMDLEQVIKMFSEVTGKNFIIEEMPKGKVIIIAPKRFKKEEAIKVFQAILNINGFTMVEMSIPNTYKIVRNAEVQQQNIPIYPAGRKPSVSETFVTRFIPLSFINATDIQAQIQGLLSKEGGAAIAYDPTNTLIIFDTALNIERIVNLLKLLDVKTEKPKIEIVKLKYSVASELAGTLSQIFGEGSKQQTPSSRSASTAPAKPKAAPAARRAAPNTGPNPNPVPNPAPEGGGEGAAAAGTAVIIIAEQRINALILIGNQTAIDDVKSLIAKLDIDVGGGGKIHVYYLENARAADMAGTLASLSGGRGGAGSMGGMTGAGGSFRQGGMGGMGSNRYGSSSGFGGGNPYDNRSGMSGQMGFGTSGGMGTGMGTGMGMGGASSRFGNRGQMGAMGAAGMAPAGGTLGGENQLAGLLSSDVRITMDEPTNSLIIVASNQDYELIKEVIKQLDIPRRQVFVEAVLVEVNLNDSLSAGLSIHGASGAEGGGAIFGGTGLTTPTSMDLLATIMGGQFTMPSGITLGAIGRPIEIPGTNGQVQIPSAGVILRLLSTYADLNVLSTPTLLTTDNEQAQIQVGQRIPVPMGQTISTGGLSSVAVSREDVGIKLQIKPQINESDNVRLDIYTEISGVVQSGMGIDVNVLGVTTSIKTAETTVIVKNEQTIVIGGLIEDSRGRSGNKVPYLGDIPVLGNLFKNVSKNTNKTNLIILITPHIVKGERDVERIKAQIKHEYDTFTEENVTDFHKWDQRFEPRYGTGSQTDNPSNGPTLDFRGGSVKVLQGNTAEQQKVEEPGALRGGKDVEIIIHPKNADQQTPAPQPAPQPAPEIEIAPPPPEGEYYGPDGPGAPPEGQY